MIKKTVKYVDFNDDPVSEDFYFHLSKAELVELEVSHDGGLSEAMKRIIAAQDGKRIIAEFKNIILGAYGERSEDGRRFIKNQRLREEFESSEAYSTLFMELVTDTDAAVEFINGIIPKGMTEEAAKAAGINAKTTPLVVVENENETEDKETPEPRIVTRAELIAMEPEDLKKVGEELNTGAAVLQE